MSVKSEEMAVAEQAVPGGTAERPQEIPARGWLQVVKRGWAEAKEDQVPLLAAGVAFYAFLAIFPAMVAGVIMYGFVADPATIATQVESVTEAMPADARQLIIEQLNTLSGQQRAGIGALVAVLLALWSASAGVANLMTAINTAYDENETRSFVKKRGVALALTLGAIVFMVILLALVAVVPAALNAIGAAGPLRVLFQILRWVVVAVVITVALAVLYRVASDRDAPKIRWVSVGAGAATLIWLLASIGFSIYVSLFGNYAKTYGALAGIVVLLFWLWITAYAILLGAEINAESEQQTVADTTTGEPRPLGDRDAVKADSVPDPIDGEPQNDSGKEKTDVRTDSESVPAEAKEELMTTTNDDGARVKAVTDPADRSLGDLVKFVTEDLSHLIRSEIKLAQLEVTEKAKGVGAGIGAFGAAGVLALFGLGLLLTTAVLALSLVLAPWLAALIVAVVVFVVAGIAALMGKKKVTEAAPPVPTRAVESVKEDVQEIKESIKR
jgi:membrane protein